MQLFLLVFPVAISLFLIACARSRCVDARRLYLTTICFISACFLRAISSSRSLYVTLTPRSSSSQDLRRLEAVETGSSDKSLWREGVSGISVIPLGLGDGKSNI